MSVDDQSRHDDERIGAVLQDRYRILEPLAAGGMGVVYRGERIKLGRPVAIKFLRALFAGNSESMKRFEREALTMSKLNHPNCASVFDIGVHESEPYIVMDFIEGHTLKQELGEHGRLSPGRAIHIVIQVLAAVSHAHSQGMVHRDIKPANVMLSNAAGTHDHVVVLDFGLAKFQSDALGNQITAADIVLGTPAYMSPEQTRSATVGPATDVYATGAMLFELLTGTQPYRGKSPLAVITAHRSAPIPSVRERLGPDASISDDIDEVLRMALAKQPEQRFSSADALAKALAAVPESAAYTPEVGQKGQSTATHESLASRPVEIRPSSHAPAGYTEHLHTRDLVVMDQPAAASAQPAHKANDTVVDQRVPGSRRSVRTAADATVPDPIDVTVLTPSHARTRPVWRSKAFVLTGLGVAGLVGLIGLGLSGDDSSEEASLTASPSGAHPATPATEVESDADPDSDAVAGTGEDAAVPHPGSDVERVADVERLIKQGRTDEAVAGIHKLIGSTHYARNGYLYLLLGDLQFKRGLQKQGLDAYGRAIRYKSKYRDIRLLNQNAIDALANDESRAAAEDLFLHRIRRAGIPHLERAARTHESEVVRRRAATLVEKLR